MTKNYLKNKLQNCFMNNGHKSKCESILKKSIKFFQKHNKKNHEEIIKQSIIKTAPPIKFLEMKNKKMKKKNKIKKGFPYILKKKNRISFGIKKSLVHIKKPVQHNLLEKMGLNLKHNSNQFVEQTKIHKETLKFKKFSFFRWFY